MKSIRTGLVLLLLTTVGIGTGFAACPTGTIEVQSGVCIIDGVAVPKYVTPLVIPPVMNTNPAGANNYDIAVRQFKQQILPGGIWNTLNGRTDAYPPTTVWSYGPAVDTAPDVAPDPGSQFNYPAYTIETTSNTPVNVRWINDLVDSAGKYRPHLLPVDQTLHWANPPQECMHGSSRTDCMGMSPKPYTGPVPIVTHVHGAHVDPHSDGYPEAWWLPAANNIPKGYAKKGTFFDDKTGSNSGEKGYADYSYRQDQPATTLWYHDHALGMTRSNVYAGPAGFWIIRGGENDKVDDVRTRKSWDGRLPGPAPAARDKVLQLNVPGDPVRNRIREIPIAIQDRSFKPDGSLFYPDNRAFFQGLNPAGGTPPVLDIPFAPDSDIAPIWNPEAFFNVMVVNGVSWPRLDVAPALYRFRLLNGNNSRFLNLALKVVKSPFKSLVGQELSFYQIGAEQGFLRNVVEIRTGFATALPGDGRIPAPRNRVRAADPAQALLMGNAERADVLVDFRLLPQGTVIQMINTGPDMPFGGFPVAPADPLTTGQVMQFVVNWNMLNAGDFFATAPWALKLNAEPALGPAVNAANPRKVSLNEAMSDNICVVVNADGSIQVDPSSSPPVCNPDVGSVPFAPKEALLGIVDATGPVPLKWTDTTLSTPTNVTMADGSVRMVNVTENPALGDTEVWEIYNYTVDGHPIHLHLVRFEVVNREPFDPLNNALLGPVRLPNPWESGYKDTVIALPGEVTRVKAKFDIAGLYVWHCHIVEHEDNEMMRPYVVSAR